MKFLVLGCGVLVFFFRCIAMENVGVGAEPAVAGDEAVHAGNAEPNLHEAEGRLG